MYGIFTYIYYQNQPNVGKYTSPMDPKTMKHEGFVPPIYGWNKLWPLKMKGINDGAGWPPNETELQNRNRSVFWGDQNI